MDGETLFYWSDVVNLLIAAILSVGLCICLGNTWAAGLTEGKGISNAV